jgi:hypothetical protein
MVTCVRIEPLDNMNEKPAIAMAGFSMFLDELSEFLNQQFVIAN